MSSARSLLLACAGASLLTAAEGALATRLARLDTTARAQAEATLAKLDINSGEATDIGIDVDGAVYFVCPVPDAIKNDTSGALPADYIAIRAAVSTVPVHHSRPGAANVIYLDFDGENISGTAWNQSNGVTTYDCRPFDLDGDETTFNDEEQARILAVWQRVSEDYSAYDVDVTTERPAAFGPKVGHCLITRSTDRNGVSCPGSAGGGVAYVDVFGRSDYTDYQPAWVFFDNLAGGQASSVAEASSHEVGHNMGLSHDGDNAGNAYYPGHGTYSGAGSSDDFWSPIMGNSYRARVSHWSKGEYFNSNETEDDLAIIDGKLGYRGDDHAGTAAAATALPVTVNGAIDTSQAGSLGVIERNDDVDVFSFTGSGAISITADNFDDTVTTASGRPFGGNLDLALELYDTAGGLVASAGSSDINEDPRTATKATLTATLAAGTYYLHVSGVGIGSPLADPPTGYTAYSSLGQYWLSGTVSPPPTGRTITITVALGGAPQSGLELTLDGSTTTSADTNGTGFWTGQDAAASHTVTFGTIAPSAVGYRRR